MVPAKGQSVKETKRGPCEEWAKQIEGLSLQDWCYDVGPWGRQAVVGKCIEPGFVDSNTIPERIWEIKRNHFLVK